MLTNCTRLFPEVGGLSHGVANWLYSQRKHVQMCRLKLLSEIYRVKERYKYTRIAVDLSLNGRFTVKK